MSAGIKRIIRFLEKTGAGLPLILALLFLASCTNIKFGGRSPAGNTTPFADSGGSTSGGQFQESEGQFQLNQVVVDPRFNGAMLNVIGQNGEFDQFCAGTYGACSCAFTYTVNGLERDDLAPQTLAYQESNLVRCTNQIPQGASSFTLQIRTATAPNGGTPPVSNKITVTLGSNNSIETNMVYANLEDEKSYRQVLRYQCRKLEFISSPFDSTFLDPIQSQDPRVIYPFNYYTTNIGESILALQRNGTDSGWECTLSPTFDYSLQWWANPMVFSRANCSGSSGSDPGSDFCRGDGELIYPNGSLESGKIPLLGSQATGKTRASFWLLPRAYGVFTVPVTAATAPLNYTTSYYSGQQVDSALTLGSLGFAARPVVDPNGGSRCPNIKLPPRSRWVKLWNFKSVNLTPPKRVVSTQATRSSPIACLSGDPGDFFDSCYFFDGNPPSSGTDYKPLKAADAGTLADMARRIILTGGAGGGSSRQISACYDLKNDWDLFFASKFAFSFDSMTNNAHLTLKGYPFFVYDQLSATMPMASSSPVQMPGGAQYTGLFATSSPVNLEDAPKDLVEDRDLQAFSQNPYVDQLFVVSDEKVTIADFGFNGVGWKYLTPVTYRTRGECFGPSRSGCKDELNWELKTSNPLGVEAYPLCVLQFWE